MANDQIKKADNGTYYFRANLGFDHSTGKRIQKYRSGFKTKKEAKEEYAKLVLQFASQSLPTEQKRIPFGTFIEDTYLPWYQTQVKESTFENRAGTVRKHFSCFYEKFTDAIEPIDIQNWQLALIRAGYSPNYVRVTQGMLSVAFDRAVILGITERNPSRMVGNVRGQKPLVDFWTLDEFEKVISKLYKGDYYEHYLGKHLPSCGAISTSRPGFVPSPKRSITTTSRTTSSRNRRRVRQSAPSIWMRTRFPNSPHGARCSALSSLTVSSY